jgi:hypothetical protein
VGGSGWQAAFSFGSAPVAWFPLGPREPWVPWYGTSFSYLHAVNAPHLELRGNVEVSRIRYINRDAPGAVTAVPRDVFMRARPVNGAAVAVPREVFRGSTPTQVGPGRPSRADFAHIDRPGSAPPAAVIDRSVVVRRTPADAAQARFRSAPQANAFRSAPPANALPRSAPPQVARPGPFGQPAQARGVQHPSPERVIPQDRPRLERVAPSPGIAPQARPQPERVFPQGRPRPERVAPPPPIAPQGGPQSERVFPQERPPRAVPQDRVAAPARGIPPSHEGRGDQPNPHEGVRNEAHKRAK